MSELDVKPGKGASSSGSLGSSTATPGKGTLTGGFAKTTRGMPAWIDRGSSCDADPNVDGCFLADAQRTRLQISLGERVMAAQTNYKLALVELRVEQLMKKETDLNWVLGLALDVLGAHVLRVGLETLKNVRAAGLEHLSELVESKVAHAADTALHAISDEKIGEYATKAFAHVQKAAEKGGDAAANRELESTKEKSISYGDALVERCDAAFQRFLGNARATSNDAELLVLHDEMDASNHTVGSYKDELGAKIARFTRSGVDDIGSRQAMDRETQHLLLVRSTRVVWVLDPVGRGKTLWYQTSDDAAYAKAPSSKFEPEQQYGAGAELERRVPAEFADAALAKSEARWGPTQTIANPIKKVMP